MGKNVSPNKHLLSPSTVQLGCVPVTNLFVKTTEPLRLNHRRLEYPLVPEHRQEKNMEIHSILKVSASPDGEGAQKTYDPYFSYAHSTPGKNSCFWVSRRAPCHHGLYQGTDVFLSFVDQGLNPHLPASNVVYAHTLCTNREIASSLPAGQRIRIEHAFSGIQGTILERPTQQIAPPLHGTAYWQLISHLSLDHVGICQETQSIEPIKELLNLYSFIDHTLHNEAECFVSLTHRQTMGSIKQNSWQGFVPQLALDLSLDSSKPNTEGLFLLGMVFDEFFRLTASFNTLTQTTIFNHSTQEIWKKWPPRLSISAPL